jgi:hypothetical protein
LIALKPSKLFDTPSAVRMNFFLIVLVLETGVLEQRSHGGLESSSGGALELVLFPAPNCILRSSS